MSVDGESLEEGALAGELERLLGAGAVVRGTAVRPYLVDASEGRGVGGEAAAVALPANAEQVCELFAWCYERGVAIVPRGGGTGFAGGAVPANEAAGAVVVALERLDRVLALEPERLRMQVEAGVRTATVQRLARESGAIFPPDPGAAEQSQIGGNIATNAGGPHAFKYGVTGRWVLGLEAVVAPGRRLRVGGPARKDVGGYDLGSLLVGSEGTLGIVTAAWLALAPAPEASIPLVAFFADAASGCAAAELIVGSGLGAAAVEFLDAGTLRLAGAGYPGGVPAGASFMLLTEADGEAGHAARLASELERACRECGALDVHALAERAEVEALWRWRDGVSAQVTAARGGKVSEDIVVPVESLARAVEATVEIGRAHGLDACSWGHAGDGNLHSTLLVAADDADGLERAASASAELHRLATALGGAISGEHGLGRVRSGVLAEQWEGAALDLHEEIKRAFDPKGLLNPGAKRARPSPPARR